MDPLTAAGTALGMGSIACPIDPRCGVTGRQTRLAPVSERATGAGNHGEIPSCACLMGNLIGKFIIMVKWGIEWGNFIFDSRNDSLLEGPSDWPMPFLVQRAHR